MIYAIVYSKSDLASYCMFKKLKETSIKTFKFYEVENLLFNNICETLKEKKIIFLSKHESRERIKTISLHFTGNWSKAEYGGKDKEISVADPIIVKKIFLELLKVNLKDFSLTLEVTHHGPLCLKPNCFIEIGSTENEWNDKDIAYKIANSIIKAISRVNEPQRNNWKIAIGFGGTHYCPKFNKIQAGKEFALGHICPKYFIDYLSYDLFLQAIEKNSIKPSYVLIDKKGTTSKQREKIKDFVERYEEENNKNLEIINI